MEKSIDVKSQVNEIKIYEKSVITPTYNEKKNITRLIPRMASILIGHDYGSIVVDDSSSDGSAEAARELANDYPVKVLVRPGKLDLSSVVVERFKDGSKIEDIGYFFLKRSVIEDMYWQASELFEPAPPQVPV